MKGTYRARATEWALGMSGTGKEQIAVLFQIVGGEHDGKSITWFGFFTEQTVDRTLDSLRHCGWKSDSLAELDTLGDNEVELVLDEEQDDKGRERTRVKWVNRLQRLALREQMSPNAAKAFAERLRGKAVAHKQKYGPQPAPSGPRAGQSPRSNHGDDGFDSPPPDDSDDPF